MKVKNVFLCGVGGQGILLASKILSEGLAKLGYDVKMSEIHGMAQRGGSVSAQIRFGDKVDSPVIGKGEADILVAFEKIEAARWLGQLKQGGTLIVNEHEIYSLPILIGDAEYPINVIEKLKEEVENIKTFNANNMAEELGDARAQNILVLGALIKALGINDLDWIEEIKGYLPPKVHELNAKAFMKGMEQ